MKSHFNTAKNYKSVPESASYDSNCYMRLGHEGVTVS